MSFSGTMNKGSITIKSDDGHDISLKWDIFEDDGEEQILSELTVHGLNGLVGKSKATAITILRKILDAKSIKTLGLEESGRQSNNKIVFFVDGTKQNIRHIIDQLTEYDNDDDDDDDD